MRLLKRHAPAVATGVVILWIAAVCAYSIGGSPASARKAGPARLVRTALGDKAPAPKRFHERSRPITVDVVPTESAPAGSTEESRAEEKVDKPKTPDVPTRDLGHSLPVAARYASTDDLREPHHDYPALDLPLEEGTRVLAVTSGRVEATTKWGACGKGVILEGDDNFTYTYCHGSKLLVGRGRRVSEGQGVLRSGNTGDSTGPHLHLQMRRPNGKLVCPQDVLVAWAKGKAKSPWEAKRVGCHTGYRVKSKGKKRR